MIEKGGKNDDILSKLDTAGPGSFQAPRQVYGPMMCEEIITLKISCAPLRKAFGLGIMELTDRLENQRCRRN